LDLGVRRRQAAPVDFPGQTGAYWRLAPYFHSHRPKEFLQENSFLPSRAWFAL
jgi:hypothetical protein